MPIDEALLLFSIGIMIILATLFVIEGIKDGAECKYESQSLVKQIFVKKYQI
jgi:hypothetical protein